MTPGWRFCVLMCVLLTACGGGGKVDHPAGPGTEWTSFGGSPGGGRYTPANEITPQNVHALQLAWMHRSGDFRGPPKEGVGAINGPLQQTGFGVTPIVSGNTLYYCTPFNRVFALDAATGAKLWSFAAGSSVNAGATVVDGVIYWGSGYAHLGVPGFTGGVGAAKFYAFSLNRN